eukprot:GHVN01083805.1.p1 GENE.GHVN01083805.1~~GHVN01083805.1.p1  ORF type:complete len:404 (+),score=20.01 GHVN01083805.1:46-1257(+)
MGGALNKIVFQPPSATYGFEPTIWLTTKHGEAIPAFFIDRRARFTLLFSHANAEDLGLIYSSFVEMSLVWNVNVFAFEYTGYGLSTGEASEKNVYGDIEAAYKYLTDHMGIEWENIVLYGRSLGSGACVHLATKFPVRGIILQSPLLSIHRVGLKLRCTLPGDMFANVDKIKSVRCPVFIIHGTNDNMVPVYHGRELYDSCKTAVYPYWVEGAGHNDLEVCARQTFFQNVARFLQYLESDTVSRSVGTFVHSEKTSERGWLRKWLVCNGSTEEDAVNEVHRVTLPLQIRESPSGIRQVPEKQSSSSPGHHQHHSMNPPVHFTYPPQTTRHRSMRDATEGLDYTLRPHDNMPTNSFASQTWRPVIRDERHPIPNVNTQHPNHAWPNRETSSMHVSQTPPQISIS